MKDMHVHSTFSYDGVSSIEEYAKKAKEIGVDEISLTEHYDIFDGIETDKKTMQSNLYKMGFIVAKRKVEKDIKLNFGVEVGLNLEHKDRISRDIRHYDFIVGSSHIIDKTDIREGNNFFEGISRKEAYLKYLKEVLENVKAFDKEYDVYGHLDYIIRLGNEKERRLNCDEYSEIINAILEELVKKDKGIELNTSGLRNGCSFPHPNPVILRRYKELGGKIVTVGSDAKRAEDLAKGIDIAYDILESVGFNETAVYHGRTPDFVKIKELRR